MRVIAIFMLSLVGCRERYVDNDEYLPPLEKDVKEMFEFIDRPLDKNYLPKQYDK